MKTCSKCKEQKEFSEFHKQKDKEDGHRSHCKLCRKSGTRDYYNKNKEIILEKCAIYYLQNTDRIRTKALDYRNNNLERVRAYDRIRVRPATLRYKAQKAKNYADYRARKLKATPKWLTSDQHSWILWHYKHARAMTEMYGESYEVDHKLALQGETYCGLHVPWNLQVMTKSENSSKGNRYHE